jgi:hypothetical protein
VNDLYSWLRLTLSGVPAARSPIERWFIDRGVPHLLGDYAATSDIWTRALPVLLLAYVGGGLNALDLREWSAQRNLIVGAFVVAILMLGWAITNVTRRRPWLTRPTHIGPPELAAFLLGPVVPSLVFGQGRDAVETLLEGAVVLVVVYLGTSYGIVPLVIWALRRSAAQIGSLGRMVVRALPLLLLFTTFLFINAEVWQVAGTLTGPVYVITLGIFFALGSVFVLSRIPALMGPLTEFNDWAEVRELVAGTPAAELSLPERGDPEEPALSRRQRVNIGLVSVFSQALQITFVAVLLTLFFTLFGFLAIPSDTAAAWTAQDSVQVLTEWRLQGHTLQLTEPLLRVAGFLGAFTGMYFTVVLSTDATYRDEFAEDVAPEIRQALAVRVAYLWARPAAAETR